MGVPTNLKIYCSRWVGWGKNNVMQSMTNRVLKICGGEKRLAKQGYSVTSRSKASPVRGELAELIPNF